MLAAVVLSDFAPLIVASVVSLIVASAISLIGLAALWYVNTHRPVRGWVNEEAEMPANGWQPIEAAPRDGTPILAYADASFTTVEWYANGKYWSLIECGAYAEDSEWQPTHWMPLPEPPQSERTGA